MDTKRRVLRTAILTAVVLLCLSISPIGFTLAVGGGNKICSFLGDDLKPSILDQDIFEFNGTKGEKITVTLGEDSSGSHTGRRANLSLMDWVTRTWFFRTTTGVLPRTITATLPATGKYLILVAELPGLARLQSFRGAYCLTLASSAGAYATLAPTPWVEPTENSAPVANAGADQTAFVTQTVTLDGSKSSDVDGDPLTYNWLFISIPSGSGAALSNPMDVKPTFVVDKPGTYIVQLIVNDGNVDSAPDATSVSTENSKPVANAGPDTVSVVDTSSYSVVATVSVGGNPRGIDVSPDGLMVFVTNVMSDTVSVIDTTALTAPAVTINVGSYPLGIAVAPDGDKVYIANNGTNDVSVIDTASRMVTSIIPVGEWPYGIAVSPDGSTVYVANNGTNDISVIDSASETVTATIPVGSGSSGVAVTPGGTKVVVANAQQNNVSIIDTLSLTVTTTVPVGLNPNFMGKFIAGPSKSL